jgi:prepilin-type N-terminal cleavage/methylation domain-containing protein
MMQTSREKFSIFDFRFTIADRRPKNSAGENPKSKIQNLKFSRAFTLIEVMMVAAIIGLIAAMGVPSILSAFHEEPMRKAVNDSLEILSHARAQAILHGQITTVDFHPLEREIAFNGGADSSAPSTRIGAKPVNSAQFDNTIGIEALDINLLEYKDSDEARVRFFPNGTSDEMTLVLRSGGDWRKISLEVTTALASVGPLK